MAKLDGGRESTLAAGPRSVDAIGVCIEQAPYVLEVAEGRRDHHVVGRTRSLSRRAVSMSPRRFQNGLAQRARSMGWKYAAA